MDREKLIEAGVDYDGALERFVGNTALYEKYLEKFLHDTHERDAWRAYEQGDYGELLEQVHALKGLAGTLGMIPLFQASGTVVNELRKEGRPVPEVLEDQMQKLEREYEKMMAVIQK